MDIETLRDYCLAKAGVTEEIPFSKLPDLLVFKVSGKMFLATDLSNYEGITIKSDPEKISDLKARYEGVDKASYMSPKHWIYVAINSDVSEVQFREWIDFSYQLVVANLTKKQRLALGH